MAKREETKTYRIPNLEKAFAVLEALAAARAGLAFPQLLEKVACNKTSLFRIVLTLEKIGYIRKNRETGTYSITKKSCRWRIRASATPTSSRKACP